MKSLKSVQKNARSKRTTLKCDFHAHAKEDPKDLLFHSSKDMVDRYVKQGFNVAAITLHNKVYLPADLKRYAERKGILLIPGSEVTIEGKHVVVLNCGQDDVPSLKTFEGLRQWRRRMVRQRKPFLVIAPHPFYYAKSCLGDLLEKNLDCFDAIEYSNFYFRFWNRANERAARFAAKRKIPVVGTGDVHHLAQSGYTFTNVKAEKNMASILDAVKRGKCACESRPLPLWSFPGIFAFLFFVTPLKRKHR